MSPLHFATQKGFNDIVSLLLEQKNIDVNIKNEKGVFLCKYFIGHHFIMLQMKVKLKQLNFLHYLKQI